MTPLDRQAHTSKHDNLDRHEKGTISSISPNHMQLVILEEDFSADQPSVSSFSLVR